MENLISINLKLSHSINQAQEAILVLSKQIRILKAQMSSKKSATEKPATEKGKYTKN